VGWEENKIGSSRASWSRARIGQTIQRAGRPAKELKINSPAFRRKGAGGKRRRRAARCAYKNSKSRKTPFEAAECRVEAGRAEVRNGTCGGGSGARDPKIFEKSPIGRPETDALGFLTCGTG